MRFTEPYAVRPAAPNRADVNLDRNEGPQPRPGWFEDAASSDAWREYPSTTALERALASLVGVRPDQVLVTAGADDGIDRCCRAFLRDGMLLYHEPTFEMLERYATLGGATCVAVPWRRGPFPLDEFLAGIGGDAPPAMIAVVAPNNPTGTAVSSRDLERLLDDAGDIPVMLDHAYGEYADEDLTALCDRWPNLVVIRTMSKAWGLAGARVGYAISTPEKIKALRLSGAPYPVSGPSLDTALRAVRDGFDAIHRHVASVRRNRERLVKVLAACGVGSGDTEANFVFAEFAERSEFVVGATERLGVRVRNFSQFGGVRISVPDDRTVLDAVERVVRTVASPEALLFDMDGVLVDVTDSYDQCIRETAASFGVCVDAEDITRKRAAGNANNDWEVTQSLLADRNVRVALDEVVTRFQARYMVARRAERAIMDDATLRRLSARYRIAVVTGRPRAEAIDALERFGWDAEVDELVAMEDAQAKPDPAPIRVALARLGCRTAWMLGDTPDDMQSARQAGVLPIAFRTRGDFAAAGLDTATAAATITSFAQLEALLS